MHQMNPRVQKSGLLAVPGISASLLVLWTLGLIAQGYGDIYQNLSEAGECLRAAAFFAPAAAIYGAVPGMLGYLALRNLNTSSKMIQAFRAIAFVLLVGVWLFGFVLFAFVIGMLQTG